jgi:anti-sigma-K factor RskA
VTVTSGAGALSRIPPHDEFLELCAISTSGQLTREERQRLEEHLAVCPSCREAMQQYEAVVSETIPALAPDPESLEPDPLWSQEQAEAELFRGLALEEELKDRGRTEGNRASKSTRTISLPVNQATWRNVWTLYAAAMVLFFALGVCVYLLGVHRSRTIATPATAPTQHNRDVLEQQLSDTAHDREVLSAKNQQRDKLVADLRRQLGQQSAEISQMRLAEDKLANDLREREAGKESLSQERADLAEKLDAAQSQVQSLQTKLDALGEQSSQDKGRQTALETKVNELERLLRDREETLDRQDELLAHDRDIRELMGARDLYITEVYDVARNGQTKKSYGRVFYTKGKSLVFYAYDLDQQTEAKNANTFQVWGQHGASREHALNLGVFYEDNAAKKRWVLRLDDPKMLAQLDAVFVTIEPMGGSPRPSGPPLLFAYLRIDPNHP